MVGDASDAEEGRVAEGGGVARGVGQADDARALWCGHCGWWWWMGWLTVVGGPDTHPEEDAVCGPTQTGTHLAAPSLAPVRLRDRGRRGGLPGGADGGRRGQQELLLLCRHAGLAEVGAQVRAPAVSARPRRAPGALERPHAVGAAGLRGPAHRAPRRALEHQLHANLALQREGVGGLAVPLVSAERRGPLLAEAVAARLAVRGTLRRRSCCRRGGSLARGAVRGAVQLELVLLLLDLHVMRATTVRHHHAQHLWE